MAKAVDESPCCQRTRARWMQQIAQYYSAFPVIKNVKCDECTLIVRIRAYDRETAAAAGASAPSPE